MAPDIDAAASKSRADAEVDRPDRRARHAVVVACAVVAAAAASRYRRGPRVFTKTELAAYDGADEKKPIYLAIMGQVFDVTAGREFYEKGAGYECFAGRDASLAFVTGEFEKNRTDDVSALAGSQLRELKKWVNETYHFKYVYLGLLEGHFYDRNGAPTAAFRHVASSIARADADADALEEDQARYPSCSSRRTRETRTVSCRDGRVPRRRAKPGGGDRCACVPFPDATPDVGAPYCGVREASCALEVAAAAAPR